MRPGSAIAAGCLALLSVIRFTHQDYVLGALFVVLALGVLGWGMRMPAPPGGGRTADAAQESHRRGWFGIALFGFAVSLVGVFVFPPMALVVSALSVYSVYRMRRSTPDSARGRLGVAGAAERSR